MKLGNDLIHADALRRELDYLIATADAIWRAHDEQES